MKTVRLTKMAQSNPGVFDVGFTIVGALWEPAQVGEVIILSPVSSCSDGHVYTYFHTSRVTAIDGDLVTTRNSVWKMEDAS